jgi:hypothetical protein
MKEFLKQGTQESAMRLGFIMQSIGVFLITLSISFYVCKFALIGKEINNWESMGVFLLGIASIYTGAAWQKTQQKKVENEKS